MRDDAAHLLALIQEIHAGDPWHGHSTHRILEGITAKQAAVRPGGGAHSIWEIVLHLTGWTREVAARLLGATPGEPAAGDWPETGEASDARWREALRGFDAAQYELEAAVERVPDDRWNERFGWRDPALGTGKTRLETLEGLAVHDAYHAGQIALLKRMLSDRA